MQRAETNIANRIEAIDVLRGFALLGIFLRHFISRFDYDGGAHYHNQLLSKVDRYIQSVDSHFLLDKTYPIFALLFGFSMYLAGKSSKSVSAASPFQRLLGLIPFACINAVFFPAGDILGLYAVVGLLVLLLAKLPVKWLPYLAVFFLLQPLVWLQIVINLFDGGVHIINYNSAAYTKEVNDAIAQGNMLEIVWTNLTKGQIGGFLWALEVGRISQTMGLMLLGYYLSKSSRFAIFINRGKKNIRYIVIPLLVIVGTALFKKYASGIQAPEELMLILSNWSGMSFAFIYIILIIFAYHLFPAQYFAPLRFYGRMSLTNYIAQSIIGGIVFAPFAFNGAAYLSSSDIVLLFIIITIAQILFSKYWLNRNKYGPLESYWRRIYISTFTPNLSTSKHF